MYILGTGNALVDIFSFSEDETALSLGLHPNRAAHVSPERLDELMLAIRNPLQVSGGSASNALKTASLLGVETAFIGCVGTEDNEKDSWARQFFSEMTEAGVACHLEPRIGTTGRCLVIHMPGQLKAIACAPGAAPTLQTSQISEALVSNAQVLLVDGQILRNSPVFERITLLCRKHQKLMVIDIASADIAASFAAKAAAFFNHHKTILLMNSNEALHFAKESQLSGIENVRIKGNTNDRIDQVCSALTKGTLSYPLIIEKMGEKGARAWTGGRYIESPTIPAETELDDTGAGDVFAGAFLAALLQKRTIEWCLAFANRAALTKMTKPGTRLDRDEFARLKADLGSGEN